MDEYGEFRREALEALRQPMEDGRITIVRSRWSVTFPARFQLVAASNPCPCGLAHDELNACVCLPAHLSAYRERLSGPIVDRIDMRVSVDRVTRESLFGSNGGPTTAEIASRVAQARRIQQDRWPGLHSNAEIPPRDIERVCRLRAEARAVIECAVEEGAVTARGAHRAIRVARTVADLRGSEFVEERDAFEAMTYRLTEGEM